MESNTIPVEQPIQHLNSPEKPVASSQSYQKLKTKLLVVVVSLLVLTMIVAAIMRVPILIKKIYPLPTPTVTQSNPGVTPTPAIVFAQVKWLPEPQKVTDIHPLRIVDTYLPFSLSYCNDEGTSCNEEVHASYEDNATYYKVGSLTSMYPGESVYLALVKDMPRSNAVKGVTTASTIVHDHNTALLFIKANDVFILTGDYSQGYYHEIENTNNIVLPKNLKIRNELILDPLNYKIKINNTALEYDAALEAFDGYSEDTIKRVHTIDFFTQGNLTKLHDFQDGHILYSDQNLEAGSDTLGHILFPQLFLRLPTNLWSTVTERFSLRTSTVPEDKNFNHTILITWNPGLEPPDIDETKSNPGYIQSDVKGYVNELNACVGWPDKKKTFGNDLAEQLSLSELTPIGTSEAGGTMYDINDKSLGIYKDLYNLVSSGLNENGKASSLQDFINDKPVLIYKSPTGEYLGVFREDLVWQNCVGEPLIYLYPTKKTRVSVVLSDTISLSQSSPPYKNGWDVIANPDGLIVDPITKNLYNHLYWEGVVGRQFTPVSDEVVAKDNMHTYLENSLKILGLSKKEAKDFEDYWEPQLNTSPYYRILFYDEKSLDAEIPLTITPRPDHQIRIVMDHVALDAYQPAKKPLVNYPTPQREGFTVVEWGGIIK